MEQINDITECCICAEMFTDPRMLPCIHTFCLRCLEATRSKSENNRGDTMPCPVCRQQFTIPPGGLSGLQKNFFMERLMEIAKISKPLKSAVSCDVCLINRDEADIEVPDASKYCVECRENMCEICSVQHKRQKLSRDHHIVPFGIQLKDELAKTSLVTYCNQHNKEELKMYCAECKNVICMMCFAESHQMHKCSDVSKVADAIKDEIGIFLASVVEGSEEGLTRKLKLEEEKREFMEEFEIVETAIKQRVNEMKQLIDEHAKVLLDELVQRKATRIKETESKNEEIERYRAIVDSFSTYCSEIKSKGNVTELCRSVHDLRIRANELQEVNATQIKQDSPASRVCFKTSEITNILKLENIVGSLAVPVDFIGRLKCPNVKAVTKLDDKIYVLCRLSSFSSGIMICIFEDRNPFQVYKNIQIREIFEFQHVVSSNKLKCLYISDWRQRCIWKLNADDCRVTPWLPIERELFTLSVSNDGNLLLLRDDEETNQLEIYGSDAKIIQSISLSHEIRSPLHIVQEPNGQFIVIHKSNDLWYASWVISKLSREGEILRLFQSRGKYRAFMNPFHLCFDSENNRLFVAQTDVLKFSVDMFDLGSLEWKQILLAFQERVSNWQLSLHFDESKKQLLVGKLLEVVVYQIY